MDPNPPPPPPPPLPKLGTASRNFGYSLLTDEGDPLGHRPSIILPHLQEVEKRFFRLVHSGNVAAVQKFLEENPSFNINCVNFQGVSALLVAVQSHQEPMVKFLLTLEGIEVGDCVLHAIRENQIKILKHLLVKVHDTGPTLEFVGVTHSSDFPDNLTPLMLAAQEGHYEIIELLLERGHTISRPHSPRCMCSICQAHLISDDLLHAQKLKLNVYKAITNPAFICHSTRDPILMAFQLSVELKECADLFPEFRKTYMDLCQEISIFAANLIGCCRTTAEIELCLIQTEGMSSSNFIFPRLMLAMDYKQKAFIAHHNTQQIVESAWNGDWHDYKLLPISARLMYPIYRILMLPVITMFCLVLPHHELVAHWRVPHNKMISHFAAYLVFLLIILLESNMDKSKQKRRPPNSGLEPIIVIFVIGHSWNTIRMCLIQGYYRYFRKIWNLYAVMMNMFFLLTFVFWLASYIDVKTNDQVDLERKFWNHLDPILIAEGTFAIATLMAYFRLMFYCRLNYYMGPLQISLGKMCADIVKYITLFFIIVLSFSVAFCRFYQYYDSMVQVDTNGIKTQQVSSFINFETTLKTFFWAILCMAPLESADVIIENLPGSTANSTVTNKHDFTESVGYIAFALYEVLTVLMILNMLIATMSSTFQRVIDNIDVEWTFGKTDFYLEYMMQSTLPPPFNLIPTQLGINTIHQLIPTAIVDKDRAKLASTDTDYQALMSQLIQRYFREKDLEGPSSEIEALKEEIKELKEALRELLEAE